MPQGGRTETFIMLFFGKTDKGRTRSSNQDAFAAAEFNDSTAFFLVCDGMGGARGGEEASSIAIDAAMKSVTEDVSALLSDESLDRSKYMPKILTYAAEGANLAVYDRATDEPEFTGMGTTFVGAIIMGETMYVVNVGDSRLYLITEDEVKQVTRDHSYVQYLVDMGVMTSEQAETSSKKNIITKAVGTGDKVNPDTFTVSLEGVSYVLLCSDGLTNMVNKSEILALVSGEGELGEKVDALVAKANENGGKDNITAVLVKPN